MANNLRVLREARGWSQTEAAAALGTKLSQYGKLERSQRRLADGWIDRAAAAFAVDPAEIVREGSVDPVVGHVGRYGVVTWLEGEPEPDDRERSLSVEPGALGALFGDATLVFRHERRAMLPSDIGRPVLLATEGGEILVRNLLASATRGRVHAVAAIGSPAFDLRPA